MVIPINENTFSRTFCINNIVRTYKTYLRNSTSKNRLVGLALMNIHKNISIITDDAVLNKFAHGERKLILLMYLFCNKYFVYDII